MVALTVMHIEHQRPAARSLLIDIRELHRAVLSGFGPGVAGRSGPGRVLWRLDPRTATDSLLYVQADEFPDYAELASRLSADPYRQRSLDNLWQVLSPGLRLTFRLTANPVRAEKSADDPKETRGRRQPYRARDEQLSWLLERTERYGFAVPLNSLGLPMLVVSSYRNAREPTKKKKSVAEDKVEDKGITIRQVTYDGILDVTDGALLREAITAGIGPGKGFGCGLLTLAPARESVLTAGART